MKKNKITVYNGHGSFVNKNTIAVKKQDGSAYSGTVSVIMHHLDPADADVEAIIVWS